jgi:ribosomal protein S18 acetylase RimI-like enzyme
MDHGVQSKSSLRLLRCLCSDSRGIAATEAVALHCRLATMKIRPASETDREAIWEIFQEVIGAGETYPIDSDISRDDALAYWFQPGAHAYVTEQDRDDKIVGSYTLHPNQSGGGVHVANAAFIVARHTRGQGIGRVMGEHCLSEARRLGFRAMQFNFVISTNEPAVKLWQDLGMKIVGTLPGAFHHPEKGYVDVYVMYRSLLED